MRSVMRVLGVKESVEDAVMEEIVYIVEDEKWERLAFAWSLGKKSKRGRNDRYSFSVNLYRNGRKVRASLLLSFS